jgi:branched-chain amino acid transport system substrate-binding protein
MLLLSVFTLVACQEEVVELDRITVTPPTKLEYEVGESLNTAGMVVKAIFSDGTDKTLTASEFTVTGFSSTAAGLKTLTVTYEGQTFTFSVAVFDPEAPEVALSLAVKTLPTQQIYNREEEFNAAGLTVEATYSTGRKEMLAASAYTLSGFVPGVVGKYNVTVSALSLTTSFPAEVRAITVQGVTATTITVGNTAVLAGPLAFVGAPFTTGMLAAFEQVNEAGGIGGRTIVYLNADDGFDGAVGLTNTRKLVNEDKVFALVGHFGTGTVNNTLGFIREVGVPMVYAATGVNSLYTERAPLDPVMPVQPIYLTDGRIMAARALKEALYGANNDQMLPANAKVGVIYTLTADGVSIREGIEIEARTLGKNADFIYKSITNATDAVGITAAINDLRAAGVQSLIVASNQAPFKAIIGAMQTNAFSVPVFTSYVNADPTAVDAAVAYSFPIYTNAWVDVVSAQGQLDAADFVTAIYAYSGLDNDVDRAAMSANAFATAGYIAAITFIEGLERVGNGPLTWESFTKAMESAPIDIPMGGTVDFGDGKRHGIASMSLLRYNSTTLQFEKVREIETIEEIRG